MRRVYTFTLYNFIQQVSVILMKNNKKHILDREIMIAQHWMNF